jgi:hypothetical protein
MPPIETDLPYMMTRHDVTLTVLLLLLTETISCRTINRTFPPSTAWQATPFKRVNTAAQIAADLPALKVRRQSEGSFLSGCMVASAGVRGCRVVRPQQWLPYQGIDLQDQRAVSEIAYRESVIMSPPYRSDDTSPIV